MHAHSLLVYAAPTNRVERLHTFEQIGPFGILFPKHIFTDRRSLIDGNRSNRLTVSSFEQYPSPQKKENKK